MYPILWLIVVVLDIIALVDIFKEATDPLRKAIWILIVLVFPVIGMILYFLLERNVLNSGNTGKKI